MVLAQLSALLATSAITSPAIVVICAMGLQRGHATASCRRRSVIRTPAGGVLRARVALGKHPLYRHHPRRHRRRAHSSRAAFPALPAIGGALIIASELASAHPARAL